MNDLVIAFLFLASVGVPVLMAASAVGGVFPVTDESGKPALDEPRFAVRVGELG